MCFSTDGGASTSSAQIAELDNPWATSPSTSRSRGVNVLMPWSRLLRANSWRMTSGGRDSPTPEPIWWSSHRRLFWRLPKTAGRCSRSN